LTWRGKRQGILAIVAAAACAYARFPLILNIKSRCLFLVTMISLLWRRRKELSYDACIVICTLILQA
jgi:hypothetical protein